MEHVEVSAKSQGSDRHIIGGNWFLYYNCAPSLWKGKLSTISSTIVHLPFNWSRHEPAPGNYDFGTQKLDNDLVQLCESVIELGKTPLLHLPIGPIPGIKNGSLPECYLKNLATDATHVAKSVIDDFGEIFHLYSFYHPKTYMAYRKMCMALSKTIADSGVGLQICGSLGGYSVEGVFQPLIEDFSELFVQGFQRYLNQNEIDPSRIDALELQRLRDDYHDLIIQLYSECLSDAFKNLYIGKLKVVFPDSAPNTVFHKTFGKIIKKNRYLDLFEATTSESLVCPLLLDDEKLFNDVARLVQSNSGQEKIISADLYDDDNFEFAPLQFIYLHLSHKKIYENLAQSGVKSFLDAFYGGTVLMKENLPDFEWFEEKMPTLFLSSFNFDDLYFRSVIKYFLSGGKILLDISHLSQDSLNKIDLFTAENRLKVERINFKTMVTCLTLGEGVILLLNFDELKALKNDQKQEFWEKLFSHIYINHLFVDLDKEMTHYWMRRNSRANELSYLEIRRLILVNYGKKTRYARIKRDKKFALLSISKGNQEQVKTSQNIIDIACAPGEIFCLDFGYFDS